MNAETAKADLRTKIVTAPFVGPLYQALRTVWKKGRGLVADIALPVPSTEELKRAMDLKLAIQAIPRVSAGNDEIEGEWERHLATLRGEICRRDPRNFITWDVVRHTMFHEAQLEEFNSLRNLVDWEKYASALRESQTGRPKPYAHMTSTSGNLVHHAYNYSQLFSAFSIDISACRHFFEFGGGYGSFARFVYQMGFRGAYTIYDLPELTFLQRYFLSSLEYLPISVQCGPNLAKENNVSLLSKLEQVPAQIAACPIDVFVATWSLSESPLAIRDEIFRRIGEPQYYLIAYFENFNGIDNVAYFKEFVQRRSNYTWREYTKPHLPGSRYLLGQKNPSQAVARG
jgi:hypothetical protein